MSKARVELGGRESKGQAGLVAKIDLKGVRHGDTKVDLDGLIFWFGLRPGDIDGCGEATVYNVAIARGRATRRAAGADVASTMPQKAGTTYSYCGTGWVGPDVQPRVPWLSIGFVVGDDPTR